MTKSLNAGSIAELIGGESTDDSIQVSNFSSLSEAKKESLSFYYDPSYKNDLIRTKAGLVILRKRDSELRFGPSIYVDDPYLAFAKASTLFTSNDEQIVVHKTFYKGEGSTIGHNLTAGPFSSIGKNCKIGTSVYIGSNVSIGNNVKIGNNSKIHSNVTIESNVIIGDECEIFAGAVIGSDGFGYAHDKDNSWIKIPQTGSVKIGDNVDIGANTTIDRGAIDDTVISDGVKIDNLVQIGHNCIIGEKTIIAGCVGIAGSAKIGRNCMIGGAAMIKGHISITDNTIISGGTGIGKNIVVPGKRFTNVFPYNIEHKDWLRIANNLKKIGKKND
jgi:UDP-3-O-[3-hydroxymyristoyl] glucosamine N-acyltransferase